MSPTSQVDQKPQTPETALFAVGALTLAALAADGRKAPCLTNSIIAFGVMSVTLAARQLFRSNPNDRHAVHIDLQCLARFRSALTTLRFPSERDLRNLRGCKRCSDIIPADPARASTDDRCVALQ